jgi:DNA (cytosine-5)-methyltransferase 1
VLRQEAVVGAQNTSRIEGIGTSTVAKKIPRTAKSRRPKNSGLRIRAALSLFSGAGGMDIGVMEAGFSIVACLEFDPHCCETLRAAAAREERPTQVIENDIRLVDPKGLMTQLRLRPGELDLLCGGPPCQAFSQIGKQEALSDERGLLLFQMIRFAKVFKPKSILIEQVKGLLTAKDERGRRGKVFERLLAELEDLGYVPKWKVVNAADYGVPQLRKRVFVVATRKPNGFEFPLPTHAPPDNTLGLFAAPAYRTVGEVIEGLPLPTEKNGKGKDCCHIDVTPAGDRFRIGGVPEGEYLSAQTHLPKEQRRNLTIKDTTKFLRLSRTRPANTLRCGEIFFHPTEDRYLTPREYLRIHGYPDSYILRGPIRGRSGRVRALDQHRQVANSVPPPVAKLLARGIKKVLDAQDI